MIDPGILGYECSGAAAISEYRWRFCTVGPDPHTGLETSASMVVPYGFSDSLLGCRRNHCCWTTRAASPKACWREVPGAYGQDRNMV